MTGDGSSTFAAAGHAGVDNFAAGGDAADGESIHQAVANAIEGARGAVQDGRDGIGGGPSGTGLGAAPERHVPMRTWLLSMVSKMKVAGSLIPRPSFWTWDSPITGVVPKPAELQIDPPTGVQ